MAYPTNARDVHIELTDKCQASCPMCARNWYGGSERAVVKNVEISLEEFKQWFPIEFLQGLDRFNACGNLGDPAIAKDCLEIYEYIRKCNPTCFLTMQTNGSLRTPKWWGEFAKVIAPVGLVIFGIDGFAGEHELYRKGTVWQKIIDNAKAFIAAGGIARADTIVFKHNQNRIEELKEFLLGIGFESVNIKSTQRFQGMTNFPVRNKNNELEYYLEPTNIKKYSDPVIKINMDRLVHPKVYQELHDQAEIVPECLTNQTVFINAQGDIHPCCQINSPVVNEEFDGEGSHYIIKSNIASSAQDIVKKLGIINLHGTNIIDAFKNKTWEQDLEHFATKDKKLVCIKSCAKNIRQLVEGTDKETQWVKLV